MKTPRKGTLSIEEKNSINSFAGFLIRNGSTLIRTDNIEMVIDWLKEVYDIKANVQHQFPGKLMKDEYMLVRVC
jgi:hypothetical protein